MNEFEIINKYFKRPHGRADVIVGSGDDGAVLQAPQNMQLVTSIDTLVSGVHFPENTSPCDIGYKAIAVSLSDMAAMGAVPAWVLATLTMLKVDEKWIKEFSEGFYEQFNAYNLALVGGDLTRGPLSITTQIMGFVPEGRAITRSGAKPGDLIYVTGTLGDAAMGLFKSKLGSDPLWHHYQSRQSTIRGQTLTTINYFINRLNRPTARVKEGLEVREFATAAVDVSDGLAQDLGHILHSSGVGATIQIDKIPISEPMKIYLEETKNYDFILIGGDDFELCFTAPKNVKCDYACIGEITTSSELNFFLDNKKYVVERKGYQHF